MKKIIFALLVVFISLEAKTVKDIKFEGLIHISESIAKEIIDIKIGNNLNVDKVDESVKKLFRQKYFNDVWVTEEDGVLTYHFEEKPIIANVNITGFGEGKKAEILDSIGIHKGDIFDKAKIEGAKQQVIEYLEKQGNFDSVVEVTAKEMNPGSLNVSFVVNKGENIVIKNIHFEGAENFDYDDFEPYIANREQQFLGWLWGRNDGKLKADELMYDHLRIKDVYMKNGYLDAQVSTPFLRTYFEGYFADLSYLIKEGKQYTINDVYVNFSEPVKGINLDEIKEELKLQKGKVFNVEKLRRDIKNIRRQVADRGYAFVNISPNIDQNREEQTTNVAINVQPGEKVFIKNVTISGNTRTVDRVIRREVYLTEGDEFSQTNLEDSVSGLKRTGYFSDVKITPKQIAPNQMDLSVNVNEAATGSIVGGIGYGSYDGLLLNASISDKNIFGSGIEVGADVDYSSKTIKGKLHFFNPRLFDSPYSLGGSIYNKTYDFYHYDEATKGVNVSVGRKIGRNIHASLSYIYEETELTEFSESLKDSVYYQEGTTKKGALIPSITYNNTDDYYLPRSGVVIGVSSEFAGIGGDVEFLKNNLNFSYFYGFEDLIDYDLILRYKARVRVAHERGGLAIPINEKLYMGGISTLRGYKSGSLAPKNDVGDLTGGKKMFSNSIEASIPLIESAKMRMVFFYDYGMIGEESFDEIKRSSTGTGIEWLSPLGPLQLFYSFPLDDEAGDKTSKIEFTIGRRF